MQEQPPSVPFRSLEYWKPPKAVRHIRAKSSGVYLSGTTTTIPVRVIYTTSNGNGNGGKGSNNREGSNQIEMDYGGRYGRGNENPFSDNMQMATSPGHTPAPPKYELDREDTLNPHWYDVKSWGWKAWAGIGAVVAIIIIVVVVAVVEVEKANWYPNYSQLTYTLEDTYSGTTFFDNFDYFTGDDPASGFVDYVSEATANSSTYNLTYASTSSAVLRVDTTVTADSEPNTSTRRSVRISSKKQYATGLFIFDIIHTPVGCATWPALWLTDAYNWPTNGEIDIMEAVNVVGDAQNQMTLHTTDGCTMSGVKRKETGTVLKTNCLNTTNENAGCGVDAGTATFGDTYNSNGGGAVAMELRSAGIRMWQWTRSNIPDDVTAGTPDPSTWDEATADFPSTDCDIGTHFKNQSIIANIDLCGSWAGTASIFNENCPGTCSDYVANNATAFTDSYWEFGAWNVYQAS